MVKVNGIKKLYRFYAEQTKYSYALCDKFKSKRKNTSCDICQHTYMCQPSIKSIWRYCRAIFLIMIFISSWYPFNSFIVKLKDKCRTCSPYPNIYSIDVLHLGIVSQRYDMSVTSDYLEIALWHLVWRSVIARRCFNNYPDSPQEDAYPTTVSKNYNCLWFNSSV